MWTAGLAGIALVTITACGQSATDYKKAAQKAIGGADAERVIGQGFANISCETPTNTAKGTTFFCDATGKTDSKAYKFTATIMSKTRVEITDYKPVE